MASTMESTGLVIPHTPFLLAYPHPAFVLHARPLSSKSDTYPSLHPVFGNAAFRFMVNVADKSALGVEFVASFIEPSMLRQFATWLHESDEPTYNLALKTSPVADARSTIHLDVIKTRADDFWICTTIPRTQLPRPPSPLSETGPRQSRLQRRSPGLLPHFPGGTEVPSITSAPYLSPSGEKSEMMRMLDEYDWANTVLGPREQWSESLVTALSVCMTAPHASAVWWTENAILIYNDKYVEIAGQKHPFLYGKAGPVAWAELWQNLAPLISDEVFKGKAVHRQDDLLVMERLTPARLPEETYFDWAYRPVINGKGKVEGFLNDAKEVTHSVILRRRMACLQYLSASTSLTPNKADYASAILRSLARQEFDIDVPFAAFYFCETDEVNIANVKKARKLTSGNTGFLSTPTSDDQNPFLVTVKLDLAGSIAIPNGHASAPDHMNLVIDLTAGKSAVVSASLLQSLQEGSPEEKKSSSVSGASISGRSGTESPRSTPSGIDSYPPIRPSIAPTDSDGSTSTVISLTSRQSIPWPFADAMKYRKPVHVQDIPSHLLDDLEKRGWKDRAREAVVIPIGVDEDIPQAMLVLGLNTRRPYDGAYQAWVDHVMTNLSATYKSTLSRMNDHLRAQQLAEIDAAKTTFFSNISHELRTPLTLISVPVADAANSPSLPDGTIKNNLKLAMRSIRRLSRLIDSLMDFSKIAGKKLQGQFQPVKLGLYTADLAASFRSVAEKNGLLYNVICDRNPEQPDCYVDTDFWEKSVFNIISNAYKYTLSGSITVDVKHDLAEKTASFTVRDTGSGIPPEDLDKIFMRFHRVASVSRTHEGTGIGLSLTKELINLHGGRLDVTSNQDAKLHGSTFTITLPLGMDHLPTGAIIVDSASGGRGSYGRSLIEEASLWTSTPSGPLTGDSENMTEESSGSSSSGSGTSLQKSTDLQWDPTDVVLVADDNADMRRLIRTTLSRYCKVVEAANGRDAFQLAKKIKPQVILSDVMMPLMNGLQLLEEIRLCPETRPIPVILTTAKVDDDYQEQGFSQGADDYVAKPFKSMDLVIRVHLQSHLGKRRIALERDFNREKKELQSLLELSPVAIFRLDELRSIRYVNPKWYEITGQSREEDIDNWKERIIPEERETFYRFLDSRVYSEEAKPLSFEDESTQDGRSFTIEFSFENHTIVQCQMIRVHDGGALGTLTDITKLRNYEDQQVAHAKEREALASKRAEEAEERRRGQELLIDVTSHELRQPVSVILNCSSLVRSNLALLRDDLDESYNKKINYAPTDQLLRNIAEDLEALDSIYQCGLAQERIANDVLSLSRLQLNVLRVDPVEFDLISEIRRIVSIFENEVKMKKITLQLDFGDSFRRLAVRHVSSDRSRVAQVITNLLSNAIKYTDTSTGKRDIIVVVEVSFEKPRDDSCKVPDISMLPTTLHQQSPLKGTPVFIYVSVTDSGPGVQPEDVKNLFQRFNQGSHKHPVFGGAGLGLFISKALCDLMGGGIAVDSVYGKGATFRFYIESAIGSGFNADSRAGSRSPPQGHGSSGVSPLTLAIPSGVPKPRVMIVEDNELNQKILNRQLKIAGCETFLANNGLRALELLREQSSSRPFDLILMDVEMPVMDGLTAVGEIRKMEELGELERGTNVVALTGNAREGQIQKIWQAGMTDVLIKPYRIENILSKLNTTKLAETQ